jgi:transcription antitermination protein NusB
MPIGIRRQARMVALQTLYEYDTARHDVADILQRHAEDERLSSRVVAYASELLDGVLAHLNVIDAAIQEAAPEWPISQMARIDKNILRLAIYEILYNNAVPAKAAINEAVELAKSFGSDTSSRFVNGVLGTIYSRSQALPASNAGSEVTRMSAMSKEEILAKLKPVVAEQLGVDESDVKEDASFTEDLNADSLDLVELIMSLEEQFQLQISDEDAEKITTVGEAVEYIHDKIS